MRWRNKKARILNKEREFIGEVIVDIQPYIRVLNFMDADIGTQVTLDTTHRIFCKTKQPADIDSYFVVDGLYYKVVQFKDYPRFHEYTLILTENVVEKLTIHRL